MTWVLTLISFGLGGMPEIPFPPNSVVPDIPSHSQCLAAAQFAANELAARAGGGISAVVTYTCTPTSPTT